MKEQTIENLALEYQQAKSDEVFTEIYNRLVKERLNNIEAVSRSLGASEADVLTMFNDAVLYAVTKYKAGNKFEKFFVWKYRNKRRNFLRDMKTRNNYERLEMDSSTTDDAATLSERLADEFNLEDEAIRKTDQRQLIGFLLNGEDELTTAIVKTTFENPNLGPTAIGRKLGLKHHSVVTRTYKRLAAKFDAKHPGKYQDYLVAL